MNSLISIFKEVLYLGATASILILIILLAKRVFKRALSPKWHYYIWVLLIIRLLIPFSPESSMSVYSILNNAAHKVNLSVREISVQSSENIVKTSPVVTEKINNNKDAGSDVSGGGNDTRFIVKESPKYNSAIAIAAIIWATVVLLFSIYTIYLNISFTVDVRKRYTLLKDKRINDILEDCKKVMDIKRTMPLFTSEKARTPALYGLTRTKILVSKKYMEQLSDAEIEYIFLHELSHYKRKDILINCLLSILQIVYFFNPFVWYAFKKVHEDCEISCDAAALRYVNEDEYHSYGSTIIKLIKLYSESNFIPVTAGIAKNKTSYKRRIIMISRFKKSKWTNSLLALVLIASVGLTGLTGCKISESNVPKSSTVVVSSPPNSTEDKDTAKTPEVKQETSDQSSADNDKQDENNTNTEDKTQNNTTTEKPVLNANTKTNENKEVFYGNWVIKKVLAYGEVGTYSKEDAESLIGKSLSFSKDKANFFGDEASSINKVAVNPVYKKSTVSKEDFVANYRMSFDKLGIKADSVSEVTASDSKGIASTFLIKDENTLIIIGGGTYFELVRK